AETPGSFYLNQYHSQWNIEAHEKLTGQEIWDQTDGGKVDAIVAGTGTGGTISGIGRFFKKKDATTQIIGVDPLGSVHYHLFKTGTMPTPYVYKVEGIGEDIKCEAFDTSVVDDMYQVSDYECFTTARRLVREEGLFCGGSSGGIAYIACKVAKMMGPGKSVIAMLPDSGTRYVTKYLSDEWMKMHGFLEPERGLGFIEDMLDRDREIITISQDAPIADVIELMRKKGISQIPITNGSTKPVGIVHEVDILRGLQRGEVTGSSPVKAIESKIGGLLYPKARVEELYGVFAEDQAAIIIDEGKVVGILSQIDLIEYLARQQKK
ncbi:MAG TPA: pyridoxal-phosphate dependent enzyme, partial [Phycisphaerales bacterium]|nr:pyridoxal-phosphate dependent enzyme [Phycisphaerales bacterium]